MTAAFAEPEYEPPRRDALVFEYEVPPHGTPPAEALERVAEGNVVYLMQGGEKVAAILPPGIAEEHPRADKIAKVQAIADNPNRPQYMRDLAQAMVAQIKALVAAEDAQYAEFLEELEDAADIDDITRSLSEPGESIPAERLWAELGV